MLVGLFDKFNGPRFGLERLHSRIAARDVHCVKQHGADGRQAEIDRQLSPFLTHNDPAVRSDNFRLPAGRNDGLGDCLHGSVVESIG